MFDYRESKQMKTERPFVCRRAKRLNALEAINTRSSAVRLSDPGPNDAELDIILKAGARAPDHGRLVPWRFVIIEGDARHRLGAAIAAAKRRMVSEATEDDLAKESAKVLRAPLIVAVIAKIQSGNKIPAFEQMIAVGAAVENMFLAAHAMGIGAMWKTGQPAYSPEVKHLLGCSEGDIVVAFLYLGRAERLPPPRPIELASVVRWL
jgi:nitroreductase